MHVFLLETAVAHEAFAAAQHLEGVAFGPCRFPVLADGIDGAGINGVAVDDPLQYAVLTDKVTHHDEAAFLAAETSEERLLYPFGHLAYTGFAAAHLIVVQVIHHDVVRAFVAEPQSTGRLPAAAAEEGTLVFGNELAFLPASGIVLLAEILDYVLVELEFRLKVAQQGVGIVFALAYQYHDMQLILELQPKGYAHIEVYRLGMSARPFEDGTHLSVLFDVAGGVVVEFGVGTLAVVAQVPLAEVVVILQGTGDVLLPFLCRLGLALRGDA